MTSVTNLKTIIFVPCPIHAYTHTHIQIHIKHKIVWGCLCFQKYYFYELLLQPAFICSNIIGSFLTCLLLSVLGCSVTSDSLPIPWTVAHPSCPWNFRKNTENGCHFLLRESSPTQGSNLCLWVSCISRQVLYPLCHQGTCKIYLCS